MPNLEKIKENYLLMEKNIVRKIIVCAGTGCVANGSLQVLKEFEKGLKENSLECVIKLDFETCKNDKIQLSHSGCQGFCQMGPLVTILPDDILYTKVKPEDVKLIVEKTICNFEVVDTLLYEDIKTEKRVKSQHDIPFYKNQNRIVLQECGSVDPDNIEEYIARNGYKAAEKAIKEMTSEKICNDVIEAGLRGRGGGGFLTGKKWSFARQSSGNKKYIVCNGDEGDPGAFMDRSIMEGNPHLVIEGMMIAAKAIGADEGYVYVRTEYPLAVKRIKNAVREAEKIGILGDRIFDSDFNFRINVMEGAGAFVCGEETALLGSIEGKRGMPVKRPPFPAESGLWGKPTNINNVETYANVPFIIKNGAAEFAKFGTDKSKGTKVFALAGQINNSGLVEVPMGITINEIVFNLGGGIIDNKQFKAVQLGGPSGGCIPASLGDTIIDFDSLTAAGAIMGSGGMVVMDETTCMVDMAKFFLEFTQKESCGKCTFCRIGTKRMYEILTRITEGKGEESDISTLVELAHQIKESSLCGLGQTAPNPLLTAVKFFEDEFIAHIKDKKCPAKHCKPLLKFQIFEEKCTGCTLCAIKCPVKAISGEKKKPHIIEQEKCIKCGDCFNRCKFSAIQVN